jgi:hypothetical protein
MYFGFLKRAAHRFAEESGGNEIVPCERCGSPTVRWEENAEAVCSFCKTKSLAVRRKEEGYEPPRRPKRRRH